MTETTYPAVSSPDTLIQAIKASISRVIIGHQDTVDLLLTALLSEGHVLLEDVPGTGKTMLAKSLAQSLDFTFSRIQFTPDLLPLDVTGLNYFDQKESRFVLRKGPVFTHVLLADEINRATPRTQSSLLEAMEEGQVTIDGETCVLERPFFVIATQNPVETAGTYPLPEAQLDRFLMQVSMGYPSREEELAILDRFGQTSPLTGLSPVCSLQDFTRLCQAAAQVYVHPALKGYLTDLSQATRKDSQVRSGVSPRGSLALYRAVRSYALIQGRDYAVPEDIKILAVPVLAHRLITAHSFDSRSSGQEIIRRLLSSVPLPTEDWGGRL
ncbi:MAG: MoxR family ATPase [Hungatella sp.]|nr:MoxR family ATPase [Hungatella sp.]